MRRAMDLIHYVVKDGVLDSGGGGDQNEDWDAGKTVSSEHALLTSYKGSVISLYHKCFIRFIQVIFIKYVCLTFYGQFYKTNNIWGFG